MDELFSSTTVISNADLNTLLNEGALDLARRGDAFILSATWSAVASASAYVLSGASPKVTGFLDIYWLAGGLIYTQSSGVTKTAPNDFEFVTESWLDLNLPGWQDATASDTLLKAFLSFNASGYLTLGVYPASSSTTPTFKLYFKSRGTDMDGDTKYPWTNSTTVLTHTEPYQKGIPFYALHELYKMKGHDDEKAKMYLELYLDQCAGLKEAQAQILAAELEGQGMAARLPASDQFGGL